jgi:ketosteroid isomerase-like protein
MTNDVEMLERAALMRWGKGDPTGYFEIFSPEITYFDPTTEARVDGRDALVAKLEPWTGKIHVTRFDMLRPHVQRSGDMAVLTFNLRSYREVGGHERVISTWNATEVYTRVDGTWQIAHSHWSYITPVLLEPVSELA